MANRFLRVLRKNRKQAVPVTTTAKPYHELTHSEYVSEVRFLMDELDVPTLRRGVEAFVVLIKAA